MHEVQSQLNVADCGVLDKSFPSQDPPRHTHAGDSDHPGTAPFLAFL